MYGRFPRPSGSINFGDVSEANIFAWTTWPETLWPLGIMRPKGRTIRKVMGGGEFSACTKFFFRSLLGQELFFRWIPLHDFFSDKYCFLLNSKILIHYLCVFVLYKSFYTHNRSKDTGHLNAKSFRKCTHSERGGSHLEWTVWLPMKPILCGS